MLSEKQAPTREEKLEMNTDLAQYHDSWHIVLECFIPFLFSGIRHSRILSSILTKKFSFLSSCKVNSNLFLCCMFQLSIHDNRKKCGEIEEINDAIQEY